MFTLKQLYHVLSSGTQVSELSGMTLARFKVAARKVEEYFPDKRLGYHISCSVEHQSSTVPGTRCLSVKIFLVNEDGVPMSNRQWASMHINDNNTVSFSLRRGDLIELDPMEVEEEKDKQP